MDSLTNYDNTYGEALKSEDPQAYIKKAWGDPLPYFNQFLLPHIKGKSGLDVLEIGAGLGRYTALMTPYCKLITAYESSQICIDYLNLHFKDVAAFYFRDVAIEPCPVFDLAYSFSCMLHFHEYEWRWYLEKIKRVLKPGGVAVLHYMSLPDGVETYVAQGISNFGDVGRYYFHHPANMEILLRCAGLKTISNEVPKNPIVKGHRVITGVK